MDAIQLLTRQHRELEASLETLLASEEQVFYPAVHVGKTEDVLLESLEEHLSLKRLLADLLQIPAEQPQFEAKLKVLKEQAEHHHKEEEEHLFPKVKKMMDEPARIAPGEEMLALQSRVGQGGAGEAAMEMAEDTERAAPLK